MFEELVTTKTERVEALTVSPPEAAKLARCSIPTLYKYLNSGEIASVVRGRRRFVSMASLKEFLGVAA